ncbi:MAG: Transcription elongation factor GreA [Candidatus Anoxychlamydiales bacterium]|nr:Transcription elongation factor GreA [Candidatus Anoxychlamydiales bacterium]NGX35806.1 Transcription elongation factor GreA [Candidatus Anoxychlamydiales bacterium]
MTYLNQFIEKLENNDYPGFLKIWEEYCYSDEVNFEELKKVLTEAKKSDLGASFGQHVNRALFLLEKIEDPDENHEILKLIADIQTLNDEDLAKLFLEHLKKRYHNDPLFNEKIRLIGLRSRENFQGAISKYELLTHIKKGKFVFHLAGWGTGEILDVSLLREEMVLEFEYLVGHKSLSFENALKTLVPLNDTHFLSRRFGNPDLLEKQAKDNPCQIIKLLLTDLGPKTAADIKENVCDLVIPTNDWNRWWQNARSKIKKDRKIESPKSLNEPFKLREKEIDHEEVLYEKLQNKPKPSEIIQMVYSFIRDFPETLKSEDFKNSIILKLLDVLSFEDLTNSLKLQIHFFLETLKAEKEMIKIQEIIEETTSFDDLLDGIDIVSYKKRLFIAIRKYKKDWEDIFITLFFRIEQNILRDYLLIELLKSKSKMLDDKIKELIEHPLIYPTAFLWYFQKILVAKLEKLPFANQEGISKLFEGFLILLDYVENKPALKDFGKKMVNLITADKYQLIRAVFKNASLDEIKEYLLLATKCRLLTDHDIKIIHSLAKVIYPNLTDYRHQEIDEDIIWITDKGYADLKVKLTRISTTELIDNAKEIEEARAHGDLRENAEYKAALEKRARLQGEMQQLSDQLNKIKMLTKIDVSTDKVEVGTIVESKDAKGTKKTFTILGPFEANTDKNIISFQSKLAKDMMGKSIGETFSYQEKVYTIIDIRNYFD